VLTNLQLERYYIEGVSFAINPDYNADLVEHGGEIGVVPQYHSHSELAQNYRATLSVFVVPEKGEAGHPYNIEVTARAFFALVEPSEDLMTISPDTVILQMGSILYSLIRGYISQLTAQSEHGQFLLPPLDPSALVPQNEEEEASNEVETTEEPPAVAANNSV